MVDGSHEEHAERVLGRAIALGLPVVAVAGAVVAGALAGAGAALLVLAAATLFGSIGVLWASVRTLSGDAPLATDFEALVTDAPRAHALGEDKRRLLRGLKDLQNEHGLGKIDDADYQMLLERYREETKAVMREMDAEISPFREEADRLVRDHLAKRGLGPKAAPHVARDPAAPASSRRIECSSCRASNEPDALFCKQCGASLKKEQGGAQA
jgi:hypothetical protein